MPKYKCIYGFNEKIIEASNTDEARDEFAFSFIENIDEINDFLLQDIIFCTKVEEIK